MPQYEFIGKTPLPRGFSFPIKRSELDAFLAREQLADVTGMAFCGAAKDQRLISAHYYDLRLGSGRSVTLWINAVPSPLRKRINEKFLGELLPALTAWMRPFADKTTQAAHLDHRFDAFYEQGEEDTIGLRFEIDAPSPVRKHGKFRAPIR